MALARQELTPALSWVLEEEFGSNWWDLGVLAPLRRESSPYLRDLPSTGNGDDLDLYLCLKLTRAHRLLFEKHLHWDESVWRAVSEVSRARNAYEGHVTKNREDALTALRARSILQNISLLLLRLHENHESDSIALMKPLAKELELTTSSEIKSPPKFRPPEKRRKVISGQQSWTIVKPASPVSPPVSGEIPALPPDLRDVKISSQLDPGGVADIRKPEKPKSPLDMPEFPSYLKASSVEPLPRPPQTRRPPEESEVLSAEPFIPTQAHLPFRTLTRKQPASKGSSASVPSGKAGRKRLPSLPEDPYAVVPSLIPEEMDTLRQIQQSVRMQAPPPPAPRDTMQQPVKVKVRGSRRKAPPSEYLGWQGLLRLFFLLAGVGGLLYLLFWLDTLIKKT